MMIYVHTKTCTQIFKTALYIMPKLETTQVSSNEWMVRQSVVHPHHGILLSNEKEQIIDLHDNVDQSSENDAE